MRNINLKKVENKNFKYYNVITVIFIITLISANIGATKLWQFGSFILPGGIIVFPLLYVLNDIATEVYGFSASRRMIWSALLSNFFLTTVLFIIVYLPPAHGWNNHEEFTKIFSFTPIVFIASITSYFIGELLNASTISTLKIMLEGRMFAVRALLSTFVGALVETTIFATIAFGNILSYSDIISMVFLLTSLKVLYELAVLPVTIKVTVYLKRVEQVDSFESPSWRGVFGL